MSIPVSTSARSHPTGVWTLSALSVGLLALSSTGLRAAEADCDKIAHSTVPYEVTMKIGEAELKYQVQRSDKRETTLLIRQLDGKVTKLVNQGTFPKSMTMPNGEAATFEYSVPTDKPIYEQAPKQIDMKLKHNADVLMSTPVQLEYLPDEKVKVGECTYNTKHYVQTSSQNGRESRNEIWYSPDLEFGLKGSTTMKMGDQQMTKASAATNLTTSFDAFK